MGRVSNQAYSVYMQPSRKESETLEKEATEGCLVSLRLSRVLQAKYEPKKLATLEEMLSSDIEGVVTYAPTVWKTTACSFFSNIFRRDCRNPTGNDTVV